MSQNYTLLYATECDCRDAVPETKTGLASSAFELLGEQTHHVRSPVTRLEGGPGEHGTAGKEQFHREATSHLTCEWSSHFGHSGWNGTF